MLTRLLTALGLSAGIAACSQATASEDRPDRSVLFIGNSLTYVNDLPTMVVREIPAAALAKLSSPPLDPSRLRLLAESAHAAAESLPPDPAVAVPADTSRGSPGGGPC